MMLQYKISGHKTKRIVFEHVFSVLDSASLEQLKELSAKRRLIEESINETSHITEATAREMHGGLTSRHQQDLQRLEQYLPLLANLIFQVDSVSASQRINRSISELKVQWTSSLSSSSAFKLKGPKFYQIDSLKYELGMTLFVYGVTLREWAFEVLSKEDLQQSASLLKRAAGVFTYLNKEVLPLLQPILPPEKPPEAIASLPSVISLICLAEAQAIAIKMAETRKISAGAMAKLHYGISQFFYEARTHLQSVSRDCKDISGKFVDFVHSCRTLHELRSFKHLAESYKQCDEMGIAIGLLRRALNTAQSTPNESSWLTVFRKEVKDVSEMLKRYEEENAFGWRRKIPLDFELPALEGTKMATPIPYEPQMWEREIAFKT